MGETFIDRLLDNPDMLKAILSMPDRVNSQLPKARRKEVFSFIYEADGVNKRELLNSVKEFEDSFADRHSETNVPDWMLRCEAQDVLINRAYNEHKEHILENE